MSAPDRPDASFEGFVAAHGDAIATLARGLSAHDEDADELAERALARVLRRWRRLRPVDGDPEAAYGAVVRAMVDLAPGPGEPPTAISHRGSEDVDLDSFGPGPVASSASVPRQGALDPVAALRRVAPDQRAVLLLRWLEGRDDEGVGRVLGVDAVEAGRRGRLALEESGLAHQG